MAFSSFLVTQEESAIDFLYNFELACLLSDQDHVNSKLRRFSLCLRAGAKDWYNGLSKPIKEDWDLLMQSFSNRFMPKKSAKDLLETLKWLQQEDLQSYDSYKQLFLDALFCLELS